MKTKLSFFLTICTLSVYSQTLKTFNGLFTDGKTQNGTAVYT